MKNKIKSPKKGKLVYVDDTRIRVNFSTLIIKADSIIRKFGTVENFIVPNGISGVTNGKLVAIYEMNEPPPYLYYLEEEFLQPAGLELYNDYVFAYEQPLMIEDTSPYHTKIPRGPSNLNTPIPLCDKAPWLDSIISDIGNFVWDKTENTIIHDPNLISIEVSEGIVKGRVTFREKYRLRIKMISPFNGWETEETLWPPKTPSNNTYLSTRGDRVAREMLEESYELIKELDDNLGDIVAAYDDLLEELSETKKLTPSDARTRIERKIRSCFFSANFMSPTNKSRDQIEETIITYKNTGKKTYLREEGI